MKNLIYQRVQWFIVPPYWMKSAYFDYKINSAMYVIFPLNYIVQFVWFLNLAWSKFKSKPSWIDKKALEYASYMSKKDIQRALEEWKK
jgi:hypothetical protein